VEVRDESLGEVAVAIEYSPNIGNMKDVSPTRSISHERLGTLLMWKRNINRGVDETWVLCKVGELPNHLITARFVKNLLVVGIGDTNATLRESLA
jgi:hypothetical protein